MTTREENLKKINEQLEQLSDAQLDQVAGGTFDKNEFTESEYHFAGLKTEYHFFGKDEFWAKDANGDYKSITYEQANWAVKYWILNQHSQPSYETIVNNCKD